MTGLLSHPTSTKGTDEATEPLRPAPPTIVSVENMPVYEACSVHNGSVCGITKTLRV